jgi:hypothetical protein
MDFCSLQHIKVRKSTSRRVSRSCYVPPSGFGYPLDGLLLPSPHRPCFVPTALLGFTLRSIPLSQGIQHVSTWMNPHAVLPVSTTAAEATARSIRFRLLGFYPCESPLRTGRVISTPTAGCSPGFLPFQGFPTTALIEIPPDLLSRASPSCSRRGGVAGASEYQSALAWPYPASPTNRRRWARQPS